MRVVTCATARHEVIEALRWARGLLASGDARAEDIAFAAAAPGEFDDLMLAISQEANLDVHFGHGRRALTTRDGQAAAALADILLRGLSQDRVRRLARLAHDSGTPFGRLPEDWTKVLPRAAPLGTHRNDGDRLWRPETRPSPKPSRSCSRRLVCWIVVPAMPLRWVKCSCGEPLSFALAARADPGAGLSTGNIAGRSAPARCGRGGNRHRLGSRRGACRLPASLRVATGTERAQLAAGIGGGPAIALSHIVPSSELDPSPVTEADRATFHAIRISTATELICCASRRDATGRLLGLSPLMPEGSVSIRLRRARIPEHAMSEHDRLMARPSEFATTRLSVSASACWRDWNSPEPTVHDGLVRDAHPVLARALGRVHSASSLKMLLRNPLGFAWRYALGWREPDLAEEAMDLDALSFGNLVHGILDAALPGIEVEGGLAKAGQGVIAAAVPLYRAGRRGRPMGSRAAGTARDLVGETIG